MASRVFMVRPAAFGPNPQTAESNAFQSRDTPPADLPEKARFEFDVLVHQLQKAGVQVVVFDESADKANPDAVFPNNWVSFHPAAGRAILYPMYAPQRRDERNPEWVHELTKGWTSVEITDLSREEHRGRFLEGTGSLIFDPIAPIVYMARSVRSNEVLAKRVADLLNLKLLVFDAQDAQGQAIYHTNVIMGLGSAMTMGCWDAILEAPNRERIITTLTANQRPLLQLSPDQMNAFAGNWIELQGNDGPLFAASTTAWNMLSNAQKAQIEQHYTPVIAAIPNIERFGGGSVRCMICTVDRG